MFRFSAAFIIGFMAMAGITSMLFGEDTLKLSENAKPLYTIVVPANSLPQEKNAASELQRYLGQITLGKFASLNEGAEFSGKAIYLGKTKAFGENFPEIDTYKLGEDSIVIKANKNGDLFITGEGTRGTLYAMYSFLEDFCDVDWWTPTEERVPENESLSVNTPDVVYTPKMDYRDSFHMGFAAFDDVAPKLDRYRFCAKHKNNGFLNYLPDEWGGQKVCLPGGWPVFSQIIPKDRYFKDHPEWFSEIDGKRTDAQLCLSNIEMREEMAKNILGMIRANPKANMITITQNDSGKDDFCHCEKCLAANKAEGAPAGLLLQCVNHVAEKVEREFPDLYVNTLAYHYNRKEPKITKPRKNVSIQVCCPKDIYRFDAPENAEFMQTLKTWSEISPKYLAWTYLIDFGDVLNPIPNTFNIGPNIKLMADYNVTGVFAQGNAYAPIGDFVELKAWLTAKMLWNPELDDKKLIKEFLIGYYGKAAKPLANYLTMLSRDFAKRDMQDKISWHNAYATPPALDPWLSLEAMGEATRLFDKAEKEVKDNKEQLARVANARMALDFQWIIGWEKYKKEAKKKGVKFLGPKDHKAAYETFIKECQKRKVWRLCEGNGSLNVLCKAIFTK